MNGLTGSSFYDSLNKLMIGFLFLIPLIGIFEGRLSFDNLVNLCELTIGCWIVGLFFWGLFEFIIVPSLRWMPWYKTNNLDWINDTYTNVSKKIGELYVNRKRITLTHLELYDYYAIYFIVQQRHLLGSVPQLESFSAFFRNFTFVLMWWIFVILTHWWHPFATVPYTPGEMTIGIVIILAVLIFSLYFRFRIEKKIFQSIFEAYFLGSI